MDKPWMKLYTRDWLDNKELRRCSPTSRAVLADLMCLAHEGVPYGHLTDKVGPLSLRYMASRCMVSLNQFRKSVDELKAHQSLHETNGVLYVKRMIEDEETREDRVVNGSKSRGNPKTSTAYNAPGFIYLVSRESDGAVKIGIALNPTTRIYKLKSANRHDVLHTLMLIPVDDMGKTEAELHLKYDSVRVHGEWFSLTDSDISSLESSFKGSTKVESKGIKRVDARVHARADSDSDYSFSSGVEKSQLQQSADGAYNPQAGWDWFLATYPKHRLNAHQDCRLWLSIVEDAYVEGVIREKLPLFKRSAEWRRGVIPSARKFLSDRLFVMEPPPEAEGTAPQKRTKSGGYVTSAEWQRLYGEKESA